MRFCGNARRVRFVAQSSKYPGMFWTVRLAAIGGHSPQKSSTAEAGDFSSFQGGKMERTRVDHMGMLATVINALAVADCLEQRGVEVRVQTAIAMNQIAEPYIRSKAIRHLEKGRVVIFGCGTGNPFFSTDTGAVLRAAEINADAILLAKNIDGVYSADPAKDPSAVKYDAITYDEVLARHLAVMDTTATSLSMDNHIPVQVFALKDPQNILRVVMGEPIGTIVKEEL